MKSLWAKSNIYILTLAGVVAMAYVALAWEAMPAGQKALGFFVAGIVLHEWEETRFPGGFFELMMKKFGVEGYTEEQVGLAHGCVVIAIAFFAFVPFLLWEQAPWLAGIPVILGFLEALVHVAGIRIHNLKRPYSPGLATALLCLLPASICIALFSMAGAPAWQWALALLCCLAVFVGMEIGVWSSFGVDPRTVPSRMRSVAAGSEEADGIR